MTRAEIADVLQTMNDKQKEAHQAEMQIMDKSLERAINESHEWQSKYCDEHFRADREAKRADTAFTLLSVAGVIVSMAALIIVALKVWDL